MITDFLVEHAWLSPTVLALLVVFGPFVGWWLVTRPRLAWTLVGLSLLPVAALTLVPVDRTPFERCAVQWAVPTSIGKIELLANVVLFVAPVLFVSVALRRPLLALLAGSALSVVVEAIQAALLVIGRSCDTSDWLNNTIGAAIGAALGAVALLLAHGKPRGGRPGRTVAP